MSEQTILIVKDEIKMANLLQDNLKQANYHTVCMVCGDTVVPYVKETPPDLILLDIRLPEKDSMTIDNFLWYRL